MSYGRGTRLSHHARYHIAPGALLFFATFLPTPTLAQSVADTTATMSNQVIQPSESRSGPSQTMTTSFVSSSASNSTSSSAASSKTDYDPPQLFPDPKESDDGQARTEGVFNYYFLFLALFGVVTAMFLWWVHKRRKLRKEQMRLSGQNALARDLDGWVNTRRWFHGTWRHNQTATFVRREEGLNELGEAPPPYQPKSELALGTETGAQQGPRDELAIPLRVLPKQNHEQRRSPEYGENTSRDGISITRPDSASTRAERPDTADIQPGSSSSN